MKIGRRIFMTIFLVSCFFFSGTHAMTETKPETKDVQADENPHEVPLDQAHKERLLALYKAAQGRDGLLLAKLLEEGHEYYFIESIYVMTTLCWEIHGPKTSSSDSSTSDETKKFLQEAIEKFKNQLDLKKSIPTRAIDQAR